MAGGDGQQPELFQRQQPAGGAGELERLPDLHHQAEPAMRRAAERQAVPPAHRGGVGIRRPRRQEEPRLQVQRQQHLGQRGVVQWQQRQHHPCGGHQAGQRAGPLRHERQRV